MRRFLNICGWVAIVGAFAWNAAAFSLLGPTPTWQTTAIGYVDFQNLPTDVNGGPMNLGEGYRWNVPTIYYGFTPDFLHYFGERGAAEIDKAVKYLNDLPSMDTVDVNAYPLQSQRINYRASALSLYDLKSVALSWLVHSLGLTDPTRYVFTLRNRYILATSTNYTVIQRNFDPVTFEPSAYINGQLWTYYNILEPVGTTSSALVVPEPVDPLALDGLINAPVSSDLAHNFLLLGGFWTGLTRDDVGGLRYLYRSSNLNVETIPPATTAYTPGSATISDGGSSGSAWIPASPPPTNGTTTATGTTNLIAQGVRPGVSKVSFVRVNYEGFFGAFPSNTVAYVDNVFTNGVQRDQRVVRQLLAPDIVFDAQDLQGADATQTFLRQTSTMTFQNNDALNGLTTTADGPGQIQPTGTTTPSVVIALNKVGPSYSSRTPAFLSEVDSTLLWRWGSYDGSTNAPVVYPNGASILALEEQALNGDISGGVAGGGSQLSTWTPADQVYFPPGTVINTGTGGTGGTGTGTTP